MSMDDMDPTQRSMLIELLKDPRAMQMLGMTYIPSPNQALHDAANNLDMGKVSAMRRLFGAEITPNTRVSEDFGALNAMRRR